MIKKEVVDRLGMICEESVLVEVLHCAIRMKSTSARRAFSHSPLGMVL